MFSTGTSAVCSRHRNGNATETGERKNSEIKMKPVKPLSSPASLDIEGVKVHFPFNPYPCQKDYMEKVIQALHRGENALLESPTGTGKTLCLLCSALAWQREQLRNGILNVAEQQQQQSAGISAKGVGVAAVAASNSIHPQTQTGRPPTIVYASRTHSQLSQVMHELRNTRYRPSHAVLASREQLCVNDKVLSKPNSTMINNECSKLNKVRKCRFRNNLEHFAGAPRAHGDALNIQPILDVEELVTMGKKHKVCPFYHTRELVTKGADLVLLPYNYLFDKDARTSLDIVWNNAIVIFDEAHNLESFASDATSFELSGMDIAGAILEVSRGIDFASQMNAHGADDGDGLKIENLVKLKAMFLRIEDFIDRKVRPEGGSFAGEYIFEVFRWASITFSNHAVFISFVQTLIESMTEARGGTNGTPKLDHFLKCLKRAFGGSTEAQCLAKAKAFRAYVSPKKPTAKKDPRTLSYWCFAPSLAMRELADMGIRSIIVTSGTLSPIMSYSLELGIPFPLTLENQHIIKPHQVHIQVVGRGRNNKNLKSTYERREDKEYLDELGNSLVELAKIVPGGMLIFFPSYGVMNKCTESWGGPASKGWFGNQKGGNAQAASLFGPKGRNKAPTNKGNSFSFPQMSTHFDVQPQGLCIWKRLLSRKAIVVEPKSSSDMKEAIEDFDRYIAAKKSKGCILMGVCRGKISEGIDFADNRARAVIVTGIPFPPFQDPKIKLKREFLDSAKATAGMQASKEGGFQSNTGPIGRVSALDCISGSDWYSQQAHRAVNQAVGRVIRHRFDYGAVLLMDSRFGEERNQSGMSKWVRPHIRKDDGFTSTVSNLISFYERTNQDPALNKTLETHSLLKFCQPKKATRLLQYDSEEVDLETESLRIAVVDTNCSSTEMNGEPKRTEDAYIKKDRILKHIEMKPGHLQLKKVQSDGQDLLANEIAASKNNNDVGLRALFGVKRDRHREMSQHNTEENGSSWDTLNAASTKGAKGSISRSGAPKTDWTRSKPSNLQPFKPASSEGCSIGPLKPEDTRKAASIFFAAARQAMQADEFKSLKDQLLKLKAEGDTKNDKQYVKSAADLTCFLLSFKEQRLASLFLPVLPKQYKESVRLIVKERLAEKKVEKIKKARRQTEGESGVKKVLFQREVQASKLQQSEASPSEETKQFLRDKSSSLHNAAQVLKAKTIRVEEERERAKKHECNLPNKPRLPINFLREDNTAKRSRDVSIDAYLKQVASKSFLSSLKEQPQSLELKRIQSNVPKGLTCTICDNDMSNPLLAECGHSACSKCWTTWLEEKAQLTCPVCRKPTQKGKLSRVVFHKHFLGGDIPTLSQICPQEFSNDDKTEMRT